MAEMREVVIVDGLRTPFAKAGADLAPVSAQDLGSMALRALMDRLELADGLSSKARVKVDEVCFGNVGGPVDAANIARVIALNAGVHRAIPGYTVQRNCASGMESIAQAFMKIATGQADVMLVGGTESMSNYPLLFNEKMKGLFMNLMMARTMGARLGAVSKFRPNFLKPVIALQEGLTDPVCGLNMGLTAENLARDFAITREEQDAFAIHSHEKALAAQEAGRMAEEITPAFVGPKFKKFVESDIGPRAGLTSEKMAKLKPYFDRKNGTVTVGNACPITDGAVALAMMTREKAEGAGYKILGTVKSATFAGLEPERMGLGPVYASKKALDQAGMKLNQMDVIEVNEAFAAQVIAVSKASASKKFCAEKMGMSEALGEIDPAKLNMNGGAIAFGHPVGSSGSRIVLTALKQLQRSNKQFALSTLCIGGGQGGAVVLERNV